MKIRFIPCVCLSLCLVAPGGARAATEEGGDPVANIIIERNTAAGLAAAKQKDYGTAIAFYNLALEKHPDEKKSAVIYYNLGNAYYAKGDNDNAIKDYSEAIRLNPLDADAYVNRGNALDDKGEHARAMEDFNAALKIDGDNGNAFFNRAFAYQSAGQEKKALADYREVLRLYPDDAEAWQRIAWVLSTSPLRELRDGKKALEYAKKACELTGWKNRDYMDTLAAACAETGDFAGAVKYEQQYLAAPGLDEKKAAEAGKRLALYQAGKPYRVGKN